MSSTMRVALRGVFSLLIAALVAAGGCHDLHGDGDLGGAGDLSVVVGTDGGVDGGGDLAMLTGDGAVTSCPHATPRSADATRALVVSHPYSDPNGDAAPDFEQLAVDSTGAITRPGLHFSLGRTPEGVIVFTPDGSLGYVAEDDGSIGVFRIGEAAPMVVEASHKSSVYATTLWMSALGDHLIALSAQTQNNGGGVYSFPIGCDGALGAESLVVAGDLPYALVGLTGTKAALYSRSLTGATSGDNAHLVELGPPFSLIASTVAFSTANTDAIIYGAAATHDGKYVLFGDNSQFSGVPNRIAVIGIGASAVTAVQTLTPVTDPYSIVTSPYDNAALVVSGFGNAFYKLAYDPTNAGSPFTNSGDITYVGAKPEIPGGAVMVTRGALNAHVFVAENSGIRPLRFETDGTITDLGRYHTGTTYADIVGCIGIQP